MCIHQGIDHSLWQLPDSDRCSEHIDFNDPEASFAVANAKKKVDIGGRI
jgi:hypothetical protein